MWRLGTLALLVFLNLLLGPSQAVPGSNVIRARDIVELARLQRKLARAIEAEDELHESNLPELPEEGLGKPICNSKRKCKKQKDQPVDESAYTTPYVTTPKIEESWSTYVTSTESQQTNAPFPSYAPQKFPYYLPNSPNTNPPQIYPITSPPEIEELPSPGPQVPSDNHQSPPPVNHYHPHDHGPHHPYSPQDYYPVQNYPPIHRPQEYPYPPNGQSYQPYPYASNGQPNQPYPYSSNGQPYQPYPYPTDGYPYQPHPHPPPNEAYPPIENYYYPQYPVYYPYCQHPPVAVESTPKPKKYPKKKKNKKYHIEESDDDDDDSY